MNINRSSGKVGRNGKCGRKSAPGTKLGRPFLVVLDEFTQKHIELACAEKGAVTPEPLIASLTRDAVRYWLNLDVIGDGDAPEEGPAFDMSRARKFAQRQPAFSEPALSTLRRFKKAAPAIQLSTIVAECADSMLSDCTTDTLFNDVLLDAILLRDLKKLRATVPALARGGC